MKIAIIGSGISGLGAAWLLHRHHDITVYEKNDYIGGHSRTISIPTPSGSIAVDTGFIVYNERNYPHLKALFRHLNVPVQKSAMSFGASIGKGWLEYSSTGLFAQKRNVLRPAFWRMVIDIVRFNRGALACLEDGEDVTLGAFLDRMGLSDWFRRYYLQAMGAAIWSCSVATILQFPARTFLQFFKNHGLLTINDHPQWYTVSGGSREYIKRVTAPFADQIKVGCGVRAVSRSSQGVIVHDADGQSLEYDRVVFACHANQALAILENPSAEEKDVLGAFSYQDNRIIVHGDTSFMPQRRQCWASWVYMSDHADDRNPSVSLSYWMNNLQSLDPAVPVIVTLNSNSRPRADLIYDEHVFAHPVFTQAAIQAQWQISRLQGIQHTYFCGAYQRYGFHEDGLLSAVKVAQALGATIPWE